MLYELSVQIYEGMPRYPGTPEEEISPNSRIKVGDPNNTTSVFHFLHTGTHVDVPFHFDDKGNTVEKVPLDLFIYEKPVIAKLEKGRGELILRSELDEIVGLDEADILFLHTGYSRLMDDAGTYPDDFPALSVEAARYLRRELKNLKAVAIDTTSIEGASGPDEGFPVHHELLDVRNRDERPLLIYENVFLSEVAKLSNDYRVYAFPIRFVGLDASPVAMVAESREP